jgi:tetratricopeptide (TPR) repeat protein
VSASPTDSNAPKSPPPDGPPDLVEALRDRYEIIREAGRGASAIVYYARDLRHHRAVAVKALNPDVSAVAGERFLREIEVSAGMQHPHILPTYDSGIAAGRLYFVMPFVDGGSLRQRLDKEPRLPVDEALRYAHEVAVAIAFAHDRGIVHRDIKPENILFYHEHACLADFGLARAMEEIDVRVTAHGMVVGTPAYMSPEQLSDGEFDGRSDVYSLACVLYEMLAGRHAFSGKTPRELLQKRLTEPPAPVREYRADVPALVDTLLTHALAMKRDERFQSAHELASAIEEARLEISTGRSAARRRLARKGARGMRRPFIWAGAVALALTVSALAAPPIRTAVAKSRAAANARAAALAEMKTVQDLELGRQVGTEAFALAAANLGKQVASLHGRDSLYAEGLIALGRGAFQNACASFDRLRAADSLDALAWYGLGDCQALDSAVVRDAKSPSGLRFRTSWAAAANAYVRAATLAPATNRALRYGMLSSLLPITPAQIRLGRAADGTRQFYGAHPSADGDSVAFVPYPFDEIVAGKSAVLSPSLPEALRRNRDTLVAAARRWTVSFPNNPESFEALAAGLEARGELASDDEGADGALRRARSLARTPDDRLRLGSAHVRVHIKRGELDAALDLADSLLAAVATNPTREQASRLVGLAALTGRIAREAELRAVTFSSSNAVRGIAPPLTSLSSRLFARAAAGVCDDSLLGLRRQLDTLLESYSEPIRRPQFRRELITRSMSLAYPCFGARAFDGLHAELPLDLAQRAAVRGDRRRAAAILDSIETVRRVSLPGEIALDYVLQEANVRAAIGDTASAIRQLDRVLRALPTLSQFAVREEAQSAAIGRAFLLRAELARATHDTAEQRLRARQALIVWRHADASLAPIVERLRSLASPLR